MDERLEEICCLGTDQYSYHRLPDSTTDTSYMEQTLPGIVYGNSLTGREKCTSDRQPTLSGLPLGPREREKSVRHK